MNDMTKAIKPKTDQLNSDDFIAGPMTITVSRVAIKDSVEQPVSIYFDGDNGKPFKPCKSMSRVLVAAWGPDASKYVGRSMTLYRDPDVTWAGMKVGGIRISHLSHIEHEKTMALTATKQTRKPYTVKPLVANTKKLETPQELIDAGNQAAMQGVDAYKTWFMALTKDQKTSIAHLHTGWKDAAEKADTPEIQSTDVEEE